MNFITRIGLLIRHFPSRGEEGEGRRKDGDGEKMGGHGGHL
jgi:hypothetical protein